MSDNGSIEKNVVGILSENEDEEVSEIQMLTQEAVNKQIKGFVASLTSQLKKLTRVVQGMVTRQHPDHYRRTDFGTTSLIQPYISPTMTIITGCMISFRIPHPYKLAGLGCPVIGRTAIAREKKESCPTSVAQLISQILERHFSKYRKRFFAHTAHTTN